MKKNAVVAVAEMPGTEIKPPCGDRQFLTTRQIQEILPLSRRSIFEWRRKGILPAIQIGSKILYHRESVIAALLRRQNGGAL